MSLVHDLPIRALRGLGRGVVWLLQLDAVSWAFLAVFLAWGVQVVHLYDSQQSTGTGPGNASIGLSDASMWQRGGLRFFFGLPIDSNLYRPTVGWFFASMIAFWGSSKGIAVLPPLVFAVLFLASYMSCDRQERPLILVFLGIMVVFFGGIFGPYTVSLGALMTEPVAWALGIVAYLLITHGIRGDRIAMFPALVGFVALGVVAAIRGLHLAGGLLVYVGVCLWFFRRERLDRLAALLFAFLGPLAFDVVLQKAYGVENNAYQLIATFVKPPHTYVDANRFEFLRSHAPGSVALKMFANFMIHGDGVSVVVHFMAESAEKQLKAVSAPVLLVLAALATRLHPGGLRARRKTSALTAAHLVVLAAVATFDEVNRWLVLVWICVICVVGLLRRMPFTFVASALYLGCLALHICTCSAGGVRPASTFVFFLYFAIVACAWETSRDAKVPVETRPMKVVPGLAAVAMASLYLGFIVIRFLPAQQAFKRDVAGLKAAMKIADDRDKKRSLYMDGQGETFFVPLNDKPVWSIFRYSKINRSPVPDYVKNDPGYEPTGITFLSSDQKPYELVP